MSHEQLDNGWEVPLAPPFDYAQGKQAMPLRVLLAPYAGAPIARTLRDGVAMSGDTPRQDP